MKLNTLSAAIIAAGALVAGNSFALAPSQVTGHATLDLFLAGASAEDKLIQDLFSELCDAGSLDYFTDISTNVAGVYSKVEGSSYNGARCTITESAVQVDLDGNGTVDAGKQVDVFVRKRSAGGSTKGVVEVANNTPIDFMTISEANCGGAPAGVDPNGVNVWVCNKAVTSTQIPTAGIADVEPALFAANANGGSTFNASEFTSATIQSMTAVTFGVAVTKELRDTLQLVQGKTVGSDKVSDMPSLSKEQISSFFAGKPNDWSSIKVRNPDNPAAVISLTAVPGTAAGVTAGLHAPTQTRVNICTRTAGSGTRAQFNAIFMNNPCDAANALTVPGDNTPVSETTSPTLAHTNQAIFLSGVPAVHENSGAGDLGTCMDNLNDGHNWGIAYNSLEKYSSKWRFVAVSGVAPTAKNVADNLYDDWVANSMQWRAITNVPSVGQKNLLLKIASDASKPTKLVVSNDDFSTHDFILNDDGTNTATDATSVGYLALAKNFAASLPFSKANPVATSTHNGPTDTSTPASCRKQLLLKNFWMGN